MVAIPALSVPAHAADYAKSIPRYVLFGTYNDWSGAPYKVFDESWKSAEDVCRYQEAEAQRRFLAVELDGVHIYDQPIHDQYSGIDEYWYGYCTMVIVYSDGTRVPWSEHDIIVKAPCDAFNSVLSKDLECVSASDPESDPEGKGEVKEWGDSCNGVGNPCNPATGNKYQHEEDYRNGDGSLLFVRAYNSQSRLDMGLGFGWTHNHGRSLRVADTSVRVRQADGRAEPFACPGLGPCQGDGDTTLSLVRTSSGYALSRRDGSAETYDTAGKLLTARGVTGLQFSYTYYVSGPATGRLHEVIGPFGHALTLAYNDAGRLETLTDSTNLEIRYAYDAIGNLRRVDYPDATYREYHYEKLALPTQLTGVSVSGARFSTFDYEASGRAILTQHADVGFGGPQEKLSLSYVSDTETVVTDAAQTQELWTFDGNLGARNLVRRQNLADGKIVYQSFDSNNNLTCRRDEEGRVTTYTFNATNQRTGMTVGMSGIDCSSYTVTPETRTTTYQYLSPTLDAPTVIESPSVYGGQVKRVTQSYDDPRFPTLPTAITQSGFTPAGISVSRSVGIAYNTQGQVQTLDGPRTDVNDVTSFDYYACTAGGGCGQLKTVTNALGQVWTYDQYDPAGRVGRIVDPNGLVTAYGYDPRGRVATVTETPPGGTDRVTRYTYTAFGSSATVTQPDGVVLTYGYDAAQNLRTVTDSFGQQIRYTYDTRGNRVGEDVVNPDGTPVRQTGYTHDLRNRVRTVTAVIDATRSSLTQTIQDAVGNLITEIDPNTNANGGTAGTAHSYDSLNRLWKTVDTLAGNTLYAYDVGDRLKQVTAPNNAVTTYTYDDLGNLLSEISPDRGTTTYTYDAAGNLKTATDARNITVSYSYDALNRVTSIDYPGTAEDIAYTYDSGVGCTHGIGRLCQVVDGSGTQRYAYDAFGNVLTHTRIELGVTYVTHYSYDAQNRPLTVTHPGGRVVTYGRDGLGRIATVTATVAGSPTVILSNRLYRADGLVATQTFGNGLSETRFHDLAGRLFNQFLGTADTRVYDYDWNGNPIRTQTLPAVADYVYDPLDRLTDDMDTSPEAFTYDANGNRTTRGATNYAYTAHSNRLTGVGGTTLTLDAAGHTTAYGPWTYTPNQAGQLSQVHHNGTRVGTYHYNHQRQRTRKVTATATLYHYDLAGNLLLETTQAGTPLRAYVWADGIPVAQLNDDHDGDGLPDARDNCLLTPNPDQRDTDGDGYGNACDGDLNNDGKTDNLDLGLFKQRYGGSDPDADLNGDGAVNNLDLGLFKQLYGKPPGPSGPNGQTGPAPVVHLHTDPLGTPRLATDLAQRVVWRFEGNAFGDTAPDADPDGDGHAVRVNLRYAGQYFDGETGLHYNWHRYYDPRLGRYISSDPIGLVEELNSYSYVANNPLFFSDPMGLEKFSLFSRDDRFSVWERNYPDDPNVLTIFAHANPDFLFDDRNGSSDNRTPLDPKQLADLITSQTGWKPGQPVMIEGCRSAQGSDSIAEQLSRELDTTVSGHDAFLIPLPGKPGNYTYSWELFGVPLHIPGGPGQIVTFER